MKTVKTWLPVFTGFYQSYWDNELESDAESWCESEGKAFEYEDFDFEYPKYYNTIAKFVTGWVGDKLIKEIPGLSKVSFEALLSPREYNFANDAINIECEFSDFEAFHVWWVQTHAGSAAFVAYIEERYTSRSGFCSRYPNTTEGWIENTNNWRDLDNHYLGALLHFIAQQDPAEFEELDIYHDSRESVYAGKYWEKKETPRG